MESYKWSNRQCGLVIFCLTLLVNLLQPVSAIECFVCSYAPRSNSSRIDGCTESNFTDIVIDTRHCDFGCERVAIYDLNGELESYHRNCAHDETVLTNSCETHETLAVTKIVCACDYSYCNGGSTTILSSPPTMFFNLLITLLVIPNFVTKISGLLV